MNDAVRRFRFPVRLGSNTDEPPVMTVGYLRKNGSKGRCRQPFEVIGERAGTRTQDPLIESQRVFRPRRFCNRTTRVMPRELTGIAEEGVLSGHIRDELRQGLGG